MRRKQIRYNTTQHLATVALLMCVGGCAHAQETSHLLPETAPLSLRQDALHLSGFSSAPCQSQDSPKPNKRFIAVRLGVGVNAGTGFAGGLDITPLGWSLTRHLATRFTIEGIAPSRLGGSGGFIDIPSLDFASAYTLDQVYQNSTGKGAHPYVGFGIGFYRGPYGAETLISSGFLGSISGPRDKTVFGGKLFVGSDLTSTTSLEATVHFVSSQILFAAQFRLKL